MKPAQVVKQGCTWNLGIFVGLANQAAHRRALSVHTTGQHMPIFVRSSLMMIWLPYRGRAEPPQTKSSAMTTNTPRRPIPGRETKYHAVVDACNSRKAAYTVAAAASVHRKFCECTQSGYSLAKKLALGSHLIGFRYSELL